LRQLAKLAFDTIDVHETQSRTKQQNLISPIERLHARRRQCHAQKSIGRCKSANKNRNVLQVQQIQQVEHLVHTRVELLYQFKLTRGNFQAIYTNLKGF